MMKCGEVARALLIPVKQDQVVLLRCGWKTKGLLSVVMALRSGETDKPASAELDVDLQDAPTWKRID